MAIAYTVTNVHSQGDQRAVHGTFTSAAGDTGGTLGPSTHGLDYISDYEVKLDTGGLVSYEPKVTISGGTITWLVVDTNGYSGKWRVVGK